MGALTPIAAPDWRFEPTLCPVRSATIADAAAAAAEPALAGRGDLRLVPAAPSCSRPPPSRPCGASARAPEITCPLRIALRGDPAARGGLPYDRLLRVLGHIEAHIDEPISRERMAAVACLSTGRFSMAFRASMGIAPHAYLIRRRVQRAQILLATTDMSILQIALSVGYPRPGHFAHNFREVVGMTAFDYRRASRAIVAAAAR